MINSRSQRPIHRDPMGNSSVRVPLTVVGILVVLVALGFIFLG